jgi:hypothetical protein
MAKELLSEELWREVEPLLPRHPEHTAGGRPFVSDKDALSVPCQEGCHSERYFMPETLPLLDEIDAGTFASKSTELRDRMARLTLEMEAADRGSSEQADLAIKVFELSQTLVQKWLTADFSAKRQLLEIVFLNFKLDGVTLCYETRKPFDVLAKGLSVPLNRGDRI